MHSQDAVLIHPPNQSIREVIITNSVMKHNRTSTSANMHENPSEPAQNEDVWRSYQG